MPEKTCGRKYCSPRFKLGEDSLAPGKSRTGNLHLPLQILPRNMFEMLVHGSSEEAQRAGGGIQAEWEFFSSSCLVFQYGVRDFRRYEVQRLHHGSFLADEAWGRTCFATCPFHGVQSGSLRDFNLSFPKH